MRPCYQSSPREGVLNGNSVTHWQINLPCLEYLPFREGESNWKS